jgi:hypothetical protein
MNTLISFLDINWSFQDNTSKIILILMVMGFFLWRLFLIMVQKWTEKKNTHDALLRNGSRPPDFPEPISVQVIKPDPIDDPNRMIWNIPKEYVLDNISMDLQRYLESKINLGSNISIKVYLRPSGDISINFRKKKDMDWEEITILAEEHLKVFFDRSIEFKRKKDEVVASS